MTKEKPEQINLIAQDVQDLESTLRTLWDRSREAAAMIHALRDENRSLKEQLQNLEAKLSHFRSTLITRDKELEALEARMPSENGGFGTMDEDEKQLLKEKILGLLNKINSHL